MQTDQTLQQAIAERILVLDGAMGTMIQGYGLQEADFRGTRFAGHPVPLRGNNDLLALTRPDVIREIHAAYLAAGADIIETNTFNSTAVSQADYELQHIVRELNEAGARVARLAADEFTAREPHKPRFVAGVLGPTSRTASLSPDVNDPGFRNITFDGLAADYRVAIEGLIAGGADLLLIETVFDTLNAKAAIFACEQFFERARPPLAGHDLGHDHGRQRPHAVRPDRRGVLVLGGACPAAGHRPQLRPRRRPTAPPRAGTGEDRRHRGQRAPERRAARTSSAATTRTRPRWRQSSASSPTADCSTSSAAAAAPPRRTSARSPSASRAWRRGASRRAPPALRLAGLEPLVVTADSLFVNVGERTNVTGSARFARLIRDQDYDAALDVARQQVEAGAQIIDVNMDEGMLDSRAAMDALPEPRRRRTRHQPRAGDDRLLQVGRDRGRAARACRASPSSTRSA